MWDSQTETPAHKKILQLKENTASEIFAFDNRAQVWVSSEANEQMTPCYRELVTRMNADPAPGVDLEPVQSGVTPVPQYYIVHCV